MEELFFKDEGVDVPRDEYPTVERHAIAALVYDPSRERFLGLRWKSVDWETIITGGIEDEQTPEETACREILEETGYKHVKKVCDLPRFHSHFFHQVKQENRIAHFDAFVFELITYEREELAEHELAQHEPVWLTREELAVFRLPDGQRHMVDLALNHIDQK